MVDVVGVVEAGLAPSGECLHAEGAAWRRSARETLRRAARAMDQARVPRSDALDALALWRGLCAGRWSLVDRFESDGRRFLVFRQPETDVRDPRQLSPRERQVASLAAIGRSNKYIAYALGLSPSAIALHLKNAMRKLGFASRAEFVATLAPMAVAERSSDRRGS